MTARIRTQSDFWLQHAIDVIGQQYGATVECYSEDLLKFGENVGVGTSEATIMHLAGSETSETYVSTNAITHFSSSSGSDTTTMSVTGDTVSGGVFTEVSQSITLAGQTKTALTTPLARAERAYTTGGTNLVGTVYFYEDGAVTAGVPDTDSEVHLIVDAAENQSLKAAVTTADGIYGLVTKIYASINEKATANAIIRLKVREAGGVFQTKFKRGVHSAGSSLEMDIRPYLIVRPNSDVLLSAEADGVNTEIAGGFNMLLCNVQH